MSKPLEQHMPAEWYSIKMVCLTEMARAENFHLCALAADALFHARLLGEGVARECPRMVPQTRGQAEVAR